MSFPLWTKLRGAYQPVANLMSIQQVSVDVTAGALGCGQGTWFSTAGWRAEKTTPVSVNNVPSVNDWREALTAAQTGRRGVQYEGIRN